MFSLQWSSKSPKKTKDCSCPVEYHKRHFIAIKGRYSIAQLVEFKVEIKIKRLFTSGRSFYALCYLPNIRHGILFFMFIICYSFAAFCYSYSIFTTHYSYVLFEVLFLIHISCAVINNESNSITCSIGSKKIYLKRMKSLC